MSIPKPSMSTGKKWLSANKRQPLQQLYLTPPNVELHHIRPKSPKWKDAGVSTPTQMPIKQATLHRFFTGPKMAGRKGRGQIEGQSGDYSHNKYDEKDSIESVTPLSSQSKENRKPSKEVVETSKKRKIDRYELASSPTRQSPRLQAQRSRLKPRLPLPVVLSPPLPRQSSGLPPTAHSTAVRSLSPSLPIILRPSHMEDNSSSARSPSYHTALMSPVDTSLDFSPPEKALMSRPEVDLTPENPTQINEIPSSIPWENTPADGYGDAWPSSQPDRTPEQSSQAKTSIHDTQPRYDEGFRVPDPPLRTGSFDVQGKSPPSRPTSRSSALASLQNSPSRRVIQTNHNTPAHLSSSPTVDLDETQDLTQDDAQVDVHASGKKRKREPSITEIPDSVPSDPPLSQIQTHDGVHISVMEDSLVLLSQPPPSMRKKTPEIITIHSTQSQSQEYISPTGPRPTSQSLSQPFARVYSVDSDTVSTHLPLHNWASSQPTQSPVSSVAELPLTANPPSQMQLSSQNDLSRIPEPLGLTMEYGFLRKRSYENLPDLDKLEKEQEKELQQWEADYQLRRKRGQ